MFKSRTLTYVLGVNEFAVRFLLVLFNDGRSRSQGYANDNLMSLSEQQFADAAPQRADELKPPDPSTQVRRARSLTVIGRRYLSVSL